MQDTVLIMHQHNRDYILENKKPRAQPPRTERLFETLHELANAFSGSRRNRDAPGKALQVGVGQFTIREIVDLVENNQGLFAESVEFFEDSIDGFHLLIHTWMAKIEIGRASCRERV